ncbi:TRAP transporter large permease [Desulfoluna butyratoxydans]|uniref:Trap c4-dicarboxylate transport system permease dctm subunit n=1 Tax=Desulfoluna butyratoxydans TaxID=231438 RepID=A0A4U8YTT5_9BACT|nr:TRAP transporter large permease [Desulfoluna butyratoxydans]VFQ44733.1 trap c4-dicarboxylate transport system permease dctm subunit [Desulfoluna butyratoxydans]
MNGPLWMSIAFVGCMLIGVPIPWAAGVATVIGLHIIDIPFALLSQTAYNAFESFPLMTIPLFVLAGKLMEKGGMSEHLIHIARKMVGSLRGGTSLVTIVSCGLFASLTGSGPATTAAIGSITIPAMVDEGYPKKFASGISASSGALGSIIPPSNLLIIYALIAEESVPKLFLAGLVPGFMVILFLILTSTTVCRVSGFGGRVDGDFSFAPLLRALWEGKWAIGAPLIILGGIYSGVFTPTEASAVAVFYGLFVGTVIYRKLTVGHVIESLKFTTTMVGTVLVILGSTKAFGQLVAFYDIPLAVQAFFTGFTDNPFLVLMMISFLYILAGMWMESIPQVVIFTAVLLPVVKSMGVDPIFFGVLTVLTCEVGFLTPPIGVNLFVSSRIAGISLEESSVGVLPFVIPYLATITILCAMPWLTTGMVDMFFK